MLIYRRIEDVILVCCLAHCRKKFFEAVPKAHRKKLKLLDINSEQEIPEPEGDTASDEMLLPAEKGLVFCNRLFFLERLYKELPAEERKQKRLETETAVWEEFWDWLDTLSPTGGSNLNIYQYLYTLLQAGVNIKKSYSADFESDF